MISEYYTESNYFYLEVVAFFITVGLKSQVGKEFWHEKSQRYAASGGYRA